MSCNYFATLLSYSFRPAEQNHHKIDDDICAFAAQVEFGIQLDDIERAHELRATKHLHDKSRFLAVGPSGNWGANPMSNGGGQKVNFKTQVQHAVFSRNMGSSTSCNGLHRPALLIRAMLTTFTPRARPRLVRRELDAD